MSASFETRGRDAHWVATQSELESIRRRGDILTLTGAAALLASIFVYRDQLQSLAAWLVAAVLLLAVIGTSLWFVISRKRRVAIARGLLCAHCDYMPHDTEIDEVATTRTCPHCSHPL